VKAVGASVAGFAPLGAAGTATGSSIAKVMAMH